HFHRRFVGIDFGQWLPHRNLVALFLQPTRKLALFHRGRQLRHYDLSGHFRQRSEVRSQKSVDSRNRSLNGSRLLLKTTDNRLLTTDDLQIRNFPHRLDEFFEIRKRKLLEIFRVWHGHIDARNPLHRCIEIIKSMFSDLRANLCPYSAERMGLFSDYYAIRLLD